MVINTADLLIACRQASIFARDASDTMRLQIKPGEDLEPGSVRIMARADETGDNQSQLEASITGPEMEIAFNVRYMIDVLSVMSTPQVAFESNGARSPGVFKPVGEDNFLHVVMPMHMPK
jgi:DNA polymerase-3 subunit beta